MSTKAKILKKKGIRNTDPYDETELYDTDKKIKLINIMRHNITSLGETKTKGQMLLEAGYSLSTSKQPSRVITPQLLEEVEDELTLVRKIKRKAIQKITDEKLELCSPKDLTDIATKLDKIDLGYLVKKEHESGEKTIAINLDL